MIKFLMIKIINRRMFYKNRKLLKIDEIDVDKILVSKKRTIWSNNSIKVSPNKSIKVSIRCNKDGVIRPLFIKLPQMIGYVTHSDSNNTMSFKVNDNRLLKKVYQNKRKS